MSHRFLFTLFSIGAAACLAPIAASAQDQTQENIFISIDMDQSGSIDRPEFDSYAQTLEASGAAFTTSFVELDQDSDGVLSPEEFSAFRIIHE